MAQAVLIVVMLLFTASLAAIVLKKWRFPYTIGLVVVGLGLSLGCARFGIDTAGVRLTPDLIMYILLPALIFEAAVHIDTRGMMRNIVPTMVLAAPGLVISTLVVGAVMYLTTPLNLAAAMLFGALISATDPVAVIALFKEIGAPKRLTLLVDGESLFNDATAIVMFNIIKGIAFSGLAIRLETCIGGTLEFIWVFLAGLLVGAVIGAVMILIIARAMGEPLLQIALSTIVAYTAFIVADKVFGVSGVMAAVGAGVVFNYYGSTHFSADVKRYVEQFWEFMSFAANSFIFLLLGFTQEIMLVDLHNYRPLLIYIGFAVLAIIVARAIVVYGLCPIIGMLRRRDAIDWKYQTVIFWGGLRGAVPMALVLSLPAGFHGRGMLISITLGVILFTLLAQGTTVRLIMSWFKMDRMEPVIRGAYIWARLLSVRHARRRLKKLKTAYLFRRSLYRRYRREYRDLEHETEQRLHEHHLALGPADDAFMRHLWLRSMAAAKSCYCDLAERRLITPVTYRELLNVTERHIVIVESAVNPPESMRSNGFDFRAERWFFRFCSRHLPSGVLYRKLLRRSMSRDLEKSFAIRTAVAGIHRMLDCFSRFVAGHREQLDECRNYYREVIAEIDARVMAMRKEEPELTDMIMNESLLRYVLDAEKNTVDELAAEGFLPAGVAADISGELGQRLLRSIRRVS
ncbi:MAG: sodium:proton antiporter [Victivallales bacterium]|nr:sodium:proton antiporter [Victivallales bacterium]